MTPTRIQQRILSQNDKFRSANALCQKIASLVSECGMAEFRERMEVLQNLSQYWEDNRKASVIEVVEANYNSLPFFSSADGITSDRTDSAPASTSEDSSEGGLPGDQATIEEDSSVPTSTSDHSSVPEDQATTPEESSAPEDQSTASEEESVPATTSDHSSVSVTRLDPSSAPAACAIATLDNVSLPSKVKKRGRPKGSGQTVIGLPNKKRRRLNKPLPFIQKDSVTRDRQILSWFVKGEDVNKAFGCVPLTEIAIKNSNEVSSACLDNNVDIKKCRRYFDNDGWEKLLQVYESKREENYFECQTCSDDLEHEQTSLAIICDSCLEWHHLNCLGKKTAPKSKYWFCRNCTSN